MNYFALIGFLKKTLDSNRKISYDIIIKKERKILRDEK